MDSVSDIISNIINSHIGKVLGGEYKAKLYYLSSSACSFILYPISIKNLYIANLGINRLKSNITKVEKVCQILNNDIKIALNQENNVEILESTMKIEIDDRFNIYCTFGIKHLNKDTDMIFRLDF